MLNRIINTAAIGNVLTTEGAVQFLSTMENVICSVAWGRTGSWASAPTGLSTTAMSLLPQCKQWCWNLTNVDKPEFWSSITADGGSYNEWLSTTAVPSSPPNTIKYFCPIFNFTMGSINTGSTLTTHVEEECIVECRGSKY